MNQYELQSYFKSLCNSFYIAYDQVNRLEKEEERLNSNYNEEDLEAIKSLLKMEDRITIPNKYVTLNYSREELLKEKERLEAEKREYEKQYEELQKILRYWSDIMWEVYHLIEKVLYTIKNNKFSIIVTTKEEVYALILFYCEHLVKDCPVVNLEEEYKKAFPTGEEVYAIFLFTYEVALNTVGPDNIMETLYNKYF